MMALRIIQDVVAGEVTIKLPEHFEAKRVEVIMLPVEDTAEEPQQLQQLLLTAPTLSDDDLERYAQVRDWMSQWVVNGY